jgi:hypothetical protein
MIESFFKTFENFTSFRFLNLCYSSMLYIYNKIVMAFQSIRQSASTLFKSSKPNDSHICTNSCGLGWCAYGEKHQTPSYKKAQSLFCADSLFQPKKSFSHSDDLYRLRYKKVRT